MDERIITELPENSIFVFGSNTLGHHDGGGAKLAHEKFGAIYGMGYGFQGKSFAIATLDDEMQKMSLLAMRTQLETLCWIAERMPTVKFYLTPIGTGIAGFKMEELESILPSLPENIIPTWKKHA